MKLTPMLKHWPWPTKDPSGEKVDLAGGMRGYLCGMSANLWGVMLFGVVVLAVVSEATPLFLTGIVIVFGTRLVAVGSLTVGGLVTFYGYMTYLGAPMRRVLCTVETFVSARVSARKTVAILDASYGESPTVPGDSFAQTVNKRIAPR